MNTLKKTAMGLIVLAAIAGGVAGSGTAFAERGHGRGECEKRHESRNNRYAQWRHNKASEWRHLAKALGLTHEQRSQIRDIFEKNREEASPARKQLFAERGILRTLVQADAPDNAAIRAQAQKIATAEGDLAVRRAGVLVQVKAILSPEQSEKFKAIREKRDRKREHMMEKGPHDSGEK